MDETWYGVDVTWNDPSVKDFVGAKSGRENENFLLVGADTVILDLPFNVSHEVKNQAAAGGVDFNNGPILSPVAYYSSLEYGPLFSDVPSGSWYAGAVNWAVERGITYGTSQTTFSPDLTCTQVQILTFLWRAAGQPASSAELPFTLDAGLDYAEGALRWACEKGMIGAGFDPAAPCARSDAVTFIWQAAGAPEGSSGSAFTDVAPDAGCARAVAWAVNKGITAGTSQTAFTPDRVCTRAEAVTFLYRDRKENQN